MNRGKVEAWLTSVPDDDTVTVAQVLAESLRRTRTNKRLGVIISGGVSKDGRLALRKMFDDVFLIDDDLVTIWNEDCQKINTKNLRSRMMETLRAKIFAFSLTLFGKCIFLEANTLVMENIDDWFYYRECLMGTLGSSDTDHTYIFKPSMDFCKYLIFKMEQLDFSNFKSGILWDWANEWKTNNQQEFASPEIPLHEQQSSPIMEFSVEKGHLIFNSDCCYNPKVVELVDAPQTDKELAERLNLLQTLPTLGLAERVIVESWLKIFEESITGNTIDRNTYEVEPIAIVGMSCRFPGANNVEEFWNLLYSGKEGIREPPAFRWKKEHSIVGGSGNERKTNAGFLSVPVDEFDARFFGVSPKEAMLLDPQARLLHEVLWESLECSGIDPLSLHGSNTAIFTGTWMYDYKDIVQASQERDFFRTYLGNSIGAVAARLSFFHGLTGPNIATESGCSSAVVAVDMAVKSLRNGESNLAMAGGVNLLLHPFQGDIIDYVIAPDGRCKTFDEKANGFGRAEGCGVLVLKRLNDARRNNDNIWAIIRGSAISQEGISRSLGTPTVHCQALAMELALKDAGVLPEQVSFVETHGTGTAVGDPMEVAAIAKAYHTSARKEPLVIGSVKTNVGHTESCCGITGIIKTVLAMQHQVIPKHLNLTKLNPEVNLDAIPATIPLEPVPWPKMERCPRLAGVNSFGITGTDGHVIIEEASNYEVIKLNVKLERPLHLIKFSAKSAEALSDSIKLYETFFTEDMSSGKSEFHEAAYSANTGRATFGHRAFLIARNYEHAVNAIQANKLIRQDVTGKKPGKICFLFTGQGSQYSSMAKALYQSSPVFRFHFDACDRILRDDYNMDIQNIIWNSDEESLKEIGRTIYSQTSIFCVEYCLLKLWESWGIKPDVVLGHSLGEFCAVVAAGILTFQMALKLVTERSLLIDSLPKGSMLVIKDTLLEVEKLMKASNISLDIAAVNSQEQTVVAGNTEEIMQLFDICKEKGIKAIVLEATHAFHSRHMEPILEKYRQAIQVLQNNDKPTCAYISGMAGKLLEDPSTEINTDYWVRHTREKVSFYDACNALQQMNCQHFLEIGPQPVLSTFVMQNVGTTSVACFPSLRRNADEWETILTSLGKLYLQGFNVNWEGFDKPYIRKKLPSLPFHPFYRKSFWVDCSKTNITPIHPLLGSMFNNASSSTIFHTGLNLKYFPYLRDHRIGEQVIILPGAAFIEICLSGGYCATNKIVDVFEQPRHPMTIENFAIDAPLELKENKQCQLQVIVNLEENSTKVNSRSDGAGFRVKVFHQHDDDNDGEWELYASSSFFPVTNTRDVLDKYSLDRIKRLFQEEVTSSVSFYTRTDRAGFKFSEHFKSLNRYWVFRTESKKDEIVAEMNIPNDYKSYLLHPLIIDAMLQTGILTLWQTHSGVLTVPVRVGRLVWLNPIEKDATVIYLHAFWENEETCLMFILNENLSPVAFISGVEFIETSVMAIESMLQKHNKTLPSSWEEIWKPIAGPHDNTMLLASYKPIITNDDPQNVTEAIKSNEENWCTNEDEMLLIQKTNRLVYIYALKALLELNWTPYTGERIDIVEFCKKYKILPKYAQLVRFYFAMFQKENDIVEGEDNNIWLIKNTPADFYQNLLHEAKELSNELAGEQKTAVVMNIYNKIGSQLSDILSGKLSVFSILFATNEVAESDTETVDSSVEAFYLHYPGREETLEKTMKIASAILHHVQSINISSPNNVYRVLEVGAGTGSISLEMMTLLSKVWGTQFEYYYTDISPSFFTKAEMKVKEFKVETKFAAFDIEKSPLGQGIPLNYFDMVVASDVFHATKNLKQSLMNLRQTMKPHGTLLLTETLSQQDRGLTFVFGLFDGYWRFEDFDVRSLYPCVNGETWKELLVHTQFGNVHVCESYMGTLGCITAEATPFNVHDTCIIDNIPLFISTERKKWVVFSTEQEYCRLEKAIAVVNRNGFKVTTIFYSSEIEEELPLIIQSTIVSGETQVIVYAWGMDGNGMCRTDQSRIALPFMHIAKHVLSLKKPPKIYVLTNNVHAITEFQRELYPSAATLFGMVKTLKNECSDLFVRYVDLDIKTNVETLTEQILYELTMQKEAIDKDCVQVAYRNEIRYAPKFVKAAMTQDYFKNDLKLPSSTDRYQLVLSETRMINHLKFDILNVEPVGDNEIEIAVKAYALNFRDIITILKPIPEFESMNSVGLDFAGEVTKVGENMFSRKFKVGDRVFGAAYKECQLPSHMILDAEKVIKIPEKMTFAEASTLPTVYGTSYYCLISIAKMRKGETVLIHTGSGGVGLSAIYLAKFVGANIITTAGSARKRTYLRSLGLKHVFHSRNTSYQEEIMKVTNGGGVDIVLNSITGPGFKEATLNVCAQNARFVEMSKLAIWTEEEMKERRPDVQYTIVDLTYLDHSTWLKVLDSMKTSLNEDIVRPLPYTQFDALRVRQAFQYFQSAKHIGKVVVTMPQVRTKQGQWKVSIPLFNAYSIYIITGGLGGIGFEVCKWMVEKGATDIVLIGRNPPKPETTKDIDYLNKERGCNIVVKLGDVGNFSECKAIINSVVEHGGKPIRGVHHCAGVIWDDVYTKQTWNTFEVAFKPKVEGTWNLHNLTLGMSLEHFVMYSSISALAGIPTQANHAAANCFEDAFAHYRYSLGLPATAINWGQWSQVGVAKEISLPGILPVSVKRMLNGLESIFRNPCVQVCLSEFSSFQNWLLLCPIWKNYLDERIVKRLKDKNDHSNQVILKPDKFWNEMYEVETKEDKIGVVTVYVKRIIRGALRMEPDEPISEDANMQELGVDSLMAIELKNNIQSLFGSRLIITVNMLKDCNTIRDLATVLVNKILDDEECTPLTLEDFQQLLENDCILDENIKQTAEICGSVSTMKIVLITGSTGQLGPYILSCLGSPVYQSLEKIICLIRTRKGHNCPREKLVQVLQVMNLSENVDLSKVECITGDVALENFGLDGETYANLSQTVDGVIHLAVKSDHVQTYKKCENGKTDIRSVNVGGTINVLKFASTGKTKRIYYSSGLVCIFGGNNEGTLSDDWPQVDETMFVAKNAVVGYPATKFVCEMLLKQANERGIPCKVFRFPWILGDNSTGQMNYVNNHYIMRLLSCMKIKSLPSIPMPAMVMPVDICADLSMKIFWNDDAPNEIYNICHPNPELEVEFVNVAKQDFGIEMNLVDWKSKDFIDNLYATDMPLEVLKEIYADVDRAISLSDSIPAIQGYLNSPENFFMCQKLENLYPDYLKDIPSSMSIIKKTLLYVKSQGYFDKFGI